MQTLLIGIDSLDPRLLVEFEDDLPNLTRMRRGSPPVELKSIFPPDSIPAWISIFTGLNPAEHGLVYVFDVFQSQWQDILDADIDIFRYKTFWDRASASGKRVCIVFPLMAFPPWPVNGVMVSRATDYRSIGDGPGWIVERDVQVWPTAAMNLYNIPPSVRGVSGSPPEEEELGKYASLAQAAILEEAMIGQMLYEAEEWDLFFITLSWLDTIQHQFWRYMDETDPTHPGQNPYKDVIRDTYRLLDRIVGDFIQTKPEAATIVLSDHGHGMRPTKTVNINEFLRKSGYLVSSGPALNPLPYLIETLKYGLLEFVYRFGLDHLLLRLTRFKALSKVSKNVYMSSAVIDDDKSQAYLSSFAGPKSYPHGGIEINRGNLGEKSYERFREALIEELCNLRHPQTGATLVEWACSRDDLYNGAHISTCYPDIVFELKEGYGTYWSIHHGLLGTAYEHKLSSGGHKKNAVFLSKGLEQVKKASMTLMDIAPTILALLNVE